MTTENLKTELRVRFDYHATAGERGLQTGDVEVLCCQGSGKTIAASRQVHGLEYQIDFGVEREGLGEVED